MVQIYQQAAEPPSAASQFLTGIGQAMPNAVNQYFSKLASQREEQAANQAAKRLGIDTTGLDPETRKILLAQHLKGQQEQSLLQQKMSQEGQQKSQKDMAALFEDERSLENVKNTFGEKFANIWKAAPVGGKTELLKHAMDAKLRGEDIDKTLSSLEPEEEMSNNTNKGAGKVIPQMEGDTLPRDFKYPDFKKREAGYTPKDWKDERRTWRKENAPIFQENVNNLSNYKRDKVDFERMEKLSKKLPEGFGRVVINPSTGEPYAAAQLAGLVSPDVQEWLKIIARFQNRAKEAFGARVTNFDLVSFMKQFPGLLNTQEGRQRILDLMKINNRLDFIHSNAMDKIYKKYGLDGIPFEKADELAQGLIKKETDELMNKYANINESEMPLFGVTRDVKGPDGQIYEIDESQIHTLGDDWELL